MSRHYYRDDTARKAINVVNCVKTDCFAYKKDSSVGSSYEVCDALDRLYCKKGQCKFYKNKEKYKVSERKDIWQYI